MLKVGINNNIILKLYSIDCIYVSNDFVIEMGGGGSRYSSQLYRSGTYLLFREHSGRTNGVDTIEYAAFRYGTGKVRNEL